MGNQMKI